MSDRQSIQLAIQQTLENYQRCGLSWIPNSDTLPDDWTEALTALERRSATGDVTTQPSSPAIPATGAQTSTGSTRPSPASPLTAPQSSTTPPSPTSVAASHVPAAPSVQPSTAGSGQWDTEELDDTARRNLFQILDQDIRGCQKCSEICSRRQQTVFGVGPIRPTVCFMGEAPGADEDKQGEPFVGRAGQLLTRIISAMQLRREDVYILNALKCRPPGNRTPLPNEINNCQPFVETQLETLRPKYIVCLGSVAVRSLLKRDTPVGQLRGKFFDYRGAKVIVTYHPSYLLRNEDAKRLVWEDMQILMRELGIEVPKKK